MSYRKIKASTECRIMASRWCGDTVWQGLDFLVDRFADALVSGTSGG